MNKSNTRDEWEKSLKKERENVFFLIALIHSFPAARDLGRSFTNPVFILLFPESNDGCRNKKYEKWIRVLEREIEIKDGRIDFESYFFHSDSRFAKDKAIF